MPIAVHSAFGKADFQAVKTRGASPCMACSYAGKNPARRILHDPTPRLSTLAVALHANGKRNH